MPPKVRRFLAALVLLVSVAIASPGPVRADFLANGTVLSYGEKLWSSDGAYVLEHVCGFAGWCFLVWHDADDDAPFNSQLYPFWASFWDGQYQGYGEHYNQPYPSGDFGNWLAMQTDGNLVLNDGDDTPIWDTQTYIYGSSVYLSAQIDGNLVLYYNGSVPIWSRH
jgi:hypothetical protein